MAAPQVWRPGADSSTFDDLEGFMPAGSSHGSAGTGSRGGGGRPTSRGGVGRPPSTPSVSASLDGGLAGAMAGKSNVVVCCRFRPDSQREIDAGGRDAVEMHPEGTSLTVQHDDGTTSP